jgi:hypothetical protein
VAGYTEAEATEEAEKLLSDKGRPPLWPSKMCTGAKRTCYSAQALADPESPAYQVKTGFKRNGRKKLHLPTTPYASTFPYKHSRTDSSGNSGSEGKGGGGAQEDPSTNSRSTSSKYRVAIVSSDTVYDLQRNQVSGLQV